MSENTNNFDDISSSNKIESDGDYDLVLNEVLDSNNDQYKVLEFLGRGAYGQVVKCWKKSTQEIVAIKILKNLPCYAEQGRIEINILKKLNEENPDKFNFVRTYEFFQQRSHICLVFELLQKSLYDYIQENSLKIEDIGLILKQLLTGLKKLKELGIIHTDLKPQNIMLVDPLRQHCRVKIIDFGTAVYASQCVSNIYIQSRYYRAPEIILGLPFSEAIDMWSLGCVAAELLLRHPLYPGSCEFDQIRFISHIQGLPPRTMLDNAPKTIAFFNRGLYKWELKSPSEYSLQTKITSKETRKYKFSCLNDIELVAVSQELVSDKLLLEKIYKRRFIELLKKMLQLDQNQRIIPSVALNHIFLNSPFGNDSFLSKPTQSKAELQANFANSIKQDLQNMAHQVVDKITNKDFNSHTFQRPVGSQQSCQIQPLESSFQQSQQDHYSVQLQSTSEFLGNRVYPAPPYMLMKPLLPLNQHTLSSVCLYPGQGTVGVNPTQERHTQIRPNIFPYQSQNQDQDVSNTPSPNRLVIIISDSEDES